MQLVLPKKIIKAVNVQNVNSLKIKKPVQPILRGDQEWKDKNALIAGKGYIIVDFGKEMNGSIRIVTGVVTGSEELRTKIRVRFGESLSEACSELGVKGACNDHSPRDFEAILPMLSNISLGNSGFRYVRIDFLEDKNMVLQSILCENHILSKKPIYKYQGDDKRVKDIFLTAKRTIDLCAAGEYIWDGVKRDRLVWIGDMHPEMLALATLYGKLDVVERTLELVRDQTPLTLWMNGLASYSMWWMICVADYYKITGAKEFFLNQVEYLKGLINRFDEYLDKDGNYLFDDFFVDWPTKLSNDGEAGNRATNVIAMKKVIEAFNDFDIDTSSAQKVLDKLLLKPIVVKEKKQVMALKYLATGTLTDQEYAFMIEGGANGMSTFMSYYILKAIASRDVKLAFDIMKEYYGAMLDLGATTFFEDFDMKWLENANSDIRKMPKKGQEDIHGDRGAFCYEGFRHSLCHGWSSGVIRFIKEYENA